MALDELRGRLAEIEEEKEGVVADYYAPRSMRPQCGTAGRPRGA